MNIPDIKKLIRLFENSDISEIEVEQEGLRVSMKKSQPGAPVVPQPPLAVTASHSAHPAPEHSHPHFHPPVPAGGPSAPDTGSASHKIVAPMVGTFFRSPSPTSPPFVEEGDIVRQGQVLCIIEAMKLMNEIESDIDGKITAIGPENGKPVEYGEILFEIEPL